MSSVDRKGLVEKLEKNLKVKSRREIISFAKWHLNANHLFYYVGQSSTQFHELPIKAPHILLKSSFSSFKIIRFGILVRLSIHNSTYAVTIDSGMRSQFIKKRLKYLKSKVLRRQRFQIMKFLVFIFAKGMSYAVLIRFYFSNFKVFIKNVLVSWEEKFC